MEAVDKYRELFVAESRRHLSECAEVLAGLSTEEESTPKAELDALFRHLHTLKGMAASMQYGELAELCHRLEDIVAEVRAGRRTIDDHALTVWTSGADAVNAFLVAIEGNNPPPSLADVIAQSRVRAINQKLVTQKLRTIGRTGSTHRYRSRTVLELDADAFDVLVHDTEVSLKALADLERSTQDEAIGVMRSRLLAMRATLVHRRFDEVQTIIERYPRLVEDLAKTTHKRVLLIIRGGHIRLDRRLLEAIDSVLVHLVTNAVDHGIEAEGTRPAHKHPVGRIQLLIERSGDDLTFTVSDDGGGLDERKIRTVAERGGLRLPDSLADQSWLEIISLPGFSTRDEATLTSGRGVGLNAVLTTVAELNGKLSLSTRVGQGTTFAVRLPAGNAPEVAELHTINGQRVAILESAAAALRLARPGLLSESQGLLHVLIDTQSSFVGASPSPELVPLGVAVDDAGFSLRVFDAAVRGS